jgi:predicted metal-dependent hydrolase
LHVTPDFGVNERKKVVEQWEHRQLLDVIPPLLNHWQPVMGVRVAGFCVRAMKSRWGSCTIARRTIRLNLELARRHPDCLEYVLVHEMIHLLERSHNARFYTLMSHFLPDWQEREHRLNRQLLR